MYNQQIGGVVVTFGKGYDAVAKLEQEDIYLDAPNFGYFFVERPEGGFRLVEHGEKVPFEEFAAFRVPGMELVGSIKNKLFTALSRDKRERGPLLLPQGNHLVGHWLSFFVDADEGGYKGDKPKLVPIFKAFGDLKNDDEILGFASKYGDLRPRGDEKYTLSLVDDLVWCESLNLWKKEIAAVNGVVSLWEDGAEDKTLAGLLNEKLREYPSIQEYGVDGKGMVFSALRSSSLGAAVWLQLAQSVFLDGPNERIARRSFRSGEYYAQQCMAKKRTGEYTGLWYHPREKQTFYRQNYTRKKAAQEGRSVKEKRKGRMEFITPFPSEERPQKKDAP